MIVDTLTAKMAFDGSDFFAGVTAVKSGLTSMGKAAHSASSLLDEAQDELKQFAEQTKAINTNPLERYQQEVKKLNNALAMGLIDQTTFSRGIQRANSALSPAPVNAFASGLQSLGSQFLSAVGFGTAFAGVLTVINTTMSALKTVANATFNALAFGAKLAAEAEQAHVAFKVLLDDSSKAGKLMQDLEKFAIRTPFGMSGLQDATKTLLGAGVGESDLLPALQTLGEVSGGNVERLKELAIVYGQVQSKGKLLAQDFNQITEKGINMRQALADQVGVSVKDLAKTMEEGKVSFADFRNALIEVSETKFGGMMDEQSKTAIGTLDRLKEVSGGLLKDIATDLGQAFQTTDLLSNLAGFMEFVRREWKDEISNALVFVGHVAKNVFNELVKLISQSIASMGLLAEMAGRIGEATFMPGAKEIGETGKFFRQLGQFGMKTNATDFVGNFMGAIANANPIGKKQEGLEKIAKGSAFGSLSEMVRGGIGDLASGIGSGLRSLALSGQVAGGGLLNRVDSLLGGIKSGTQQEFKPTGALQAGSAEAFSAIIRNMFGKEDKNIPKEHLKAAREAVGVMKELLRTTQAAVRDGTTIIESFAG